MEQSVCVCVCVCARARARARVRVWVRVVVGVVVLFARSGRHRRKSERSLGAEASLLKCIAVASHLLGIHCEIAKVSFNLMSV